MVWSPLTKVRESMGTVSATTPPDGEGEEREGQGRATVSVRDGGESGVAHQLDETFLKFLEFGLGKKQGDHGHE